MVRASREAKQAQQVDKMIASVQKAAALVLQKAFNTEAAFDKAIQKVTGMAETLHKYLEKHAPHLLTVDQTPMGIVAEVTSDASGSNTLAESSLTARLVKTDLVSIAVASSLSQAGASGGVEYVSAATFTAVTGADFSFTKTRNITAENFEISREVLVAVDFEFLDGYEQSLVREVNLVTDKVHAKLFGNIATASFNLTATAENTLVLVDSDALVVADALSTAYVGAELFVG